MSRAPLRWTLALITSVALAGTLTACSSSDEPADAAASSAAASAEAAPAQSAAPEASASTPSGDAAAGVAPLDVPEDVVQSFLAASCVAPTESGGGGGEWDAGALSCTTPDGNVMGPETAYLALTDVGTRAYLVYSAYQLDPSATLSDCPSLDEMDAATASEPPVVSDACVTVTLEALTGALGG
jgi:hypothetical protein